MTGLSIVLAAGGTAGHVEPALNFADALRSHEGFANVALMASDGELERRLAVQRGCPLVTVPRVPLPRHFSTASLAVPGRLIRAAKLAGHHLDALHADGVVGFGGFISVPAYLAAFRRRTPIVVHEANVRPGLANRLGARLTRYVAVAQPATTLRGAVVTGIPLRPAIVNLDRSALRPAARSYFGLDADGPVLLVTGGSQGAKRLNEAVVGAAEVLADAGIQVLHAAGLASSKSLAAGVPSSHHVVGFIDQMELAYAAADFALCRAGAMTCAELAAVGLPAAYVPLPIGNGEQRLNAAAVVAAGGGLLVSDESLTAAWIVAELIPLLQRPDRLRTMAVAARVAAVVDPAEALIDLLLNACARR